MHQERAKKEKKLPDLRITPPPRSAHTRGRSSFDHTPTGSDKASPSALSKAWETSSPRFSLTTDTEHTLSFKEIPSLKNCLIQLISTLLGIPEKDINFSTMINERELFDRVSSTVLGHSGDDFSFFREYEFAHEILNTLFISGLDLTEFLHDRDYCTDQKSIIIRLKGNMFYTDPYARDEYSKYRIPGAATKTRNGHRASRVSSRAQHTKISSPITGGPIPTVQKISPIKKPEHSPSETHGEVTLLMIRRVASDIETLSSPQKKSNGLSKQLYFVIPYLNEKQQLCFDDPAFDERIAELDKRISTLSLPSSPDITAKRSKSPRRSISSQELCDMSPTEKKKELSRLQKLRDNLKKQIIFDPKTVKSIKANEDIPTLQGYRRCGLMLKIPGTAASAKKHKLLTCPISDRPPLDRGMTMPHLPVKPRPKKPEQQDDSKMFDGVSDLSQSAEKEYQDQEAILNRKRKQEQKARTKTSLSLTLYAPKATPPKSSVGTSTTDLMDRIRQSEFAVLGKRSTRDISQRLTLKEPCKALTHYIDPFKEIRQRETEKRKQQQKKVGEFKSKSDKRHLHSVIQAWRDLIQQQKDVADDMRKQFEKQRLHSIMREWIKPIQKQKKQAKRKLVPSLRTPWSGMIFTPVERHKKSGASSKQSRFGCG